MHDLRRLTGLSNVSENTVKEENRVAKVQICIFHSEFYCSNAARVDSFHIFQGNTRLMICGIGNAMHSSIFVNIKHLQQ